MPEYGGRCAICSPLKGLAQSNLVYTHLFTKKLRQILKIGKWPPCAILATNYSLFIMIRGLAARSSEEHLKNSFLISKPEKVEVFYGSCVMNSDTREVQEAE